MFVSAILSVLGLAFMAYMLFALAVYALPFFIAVNVGMYVHDSEAGLIAAFVCAFLAGIVTLVVGQIAFATIRFAPARLAIGAVFAAPAGVAGYHVIRGFSEIGDAGDTWTLVFAWIGAIVIGAIAGARITSLAWLNKHGARTGLTFRDRDAARDGSAHEWPSRRAPMIRVDDGRETGLS